jgi:erythromycin esterase
MKSIRIVSLVSIIAVIFLFSCKLRQSSTTDSGYVASTKELNWLRNNAIKIKTVEAGNGFDDLQPLKKIIGNSRIVGLGENTHGTSEVFRMKHRLVEFLIEDMGYSVFAIEANLPEAYRINDYVLNGNGDPKDLLKGLNLWPWNTQEVLDMVLWMREYNASGKGKIQFTGFDMSTIGGAFDNIRDYAFKYDSALIPSMDSISSLIHPGNLKDYTDSKIREISLEVKQISRSIANQLAAKRNSIIAERGEPGYSLLVRNAEIMIQSSDTANLSDLKVRDKYMAQNVDWILENNPGSKIILWAHSGHIRKLEGFLGGLLSQKYGNDYVNIGFLSNSGTYTASDNSGILNSANKLEPGKPGSFEYSFHKSGIPLFCIGFSGLNKSSPESGWLTLELKCGGAGSYVQPIQYYPQNLSQYFNAVIFIDSTHSSHCFNISK